MGNGNKQPGKSVQSVRGMNDLLPDESSKWQQVEQVLRTCMESFGYREIRMPVLEPTQLYRRAIGEATDVVEKEMYSFVDRSGDDLSLRPEGTAGCVRACLQHNLLSQGEQRLWYMGPMYRHERPQKGRLREFHQLGAEVFGLTGPDIDAELIAIGAEFWRLLGLQDKVTLKLNSLGQSAERAAFRENLVAFLRRHMDELDEDSRRRVDTNPLRVLDSKDPGVREVLREAPVLTDYLGDDSRRHFESLRALLDALGIAYEVDPYLVRGLDYYNLTVFEWVSGTLGAQSTVLGGGRYDGLVEQFGGPMMPAAGFGLGLERLMLMVAETDFLKSVPAADIYVLGSGEGSEAAVARTGLQLRRQLPGVSVVCHCGGGSFRKQFRHADRSGAAAAVILGEQELAHNSVTIKNLRQQDSEQTEYPVNEAAAVLRKLLSDCGRMVRG